MKMNLTVLLSIALLSLSGCASHEPAQLGDKLVWSSNDDDTRPAWTTAGQENNSNFVGQSLFHASERSAIRNAEIDASQQIALTKKQNVSVDQTETMSASAGERLILNAEASTSSQITQTANEELTGVKTIETYLENWKVGKKTLWKAFVLVAVQ